MIVAVDMVWRQNCLVTPWVTALDRDLNGSLLGQDSPAWDPSFTRRRLVSFPALVSLRSA